MLAMPTSAQSLCLADTYQRLPGSSPTSSVPSPGRRPATSRAATRSVSSARIAAAVALPSRIVAGTPTVCPRTPQEPLHGPRLGRRTRAEEHMTERQDTSPGMHPVSPGGTPGYAPTPAGASAYPGSDYRTGPVHDTGPVYGPGPGAPSATTPDYSPRPVAVRRPD